MVTKAIILAGGKGERLRPHTNDRPKPMVEVGGKPIISYQLTQFQNAGVKEVVVACSYLREVLKDHLNVHNPYGIKFIFSEEDTPLGRGGGIKQAMGKIDGEYENVIITNGDNLWRLDFSDLVKKHENRNALVTLVVVPLKSPYGIVEFNDKDEVLAFREKPVLPHWVNAGVYIFSKAVFKLLPDVGDHETETFPMLPKDRFLVFQSTDYWRGVDTVKDLTEAGKEVEEVFRDLSIPKI